MKKKLRKITDEIYSGEVILEFGGYTIRTFGEKQVWIERENGEGMSIDRGLFKHWLDKLFSEEF